MWAMSMVPLAFVLMRLYVRVYMSYKPFEDSILEFSIHPKPTIVVVEDFSGISNRIYLLIHEYRSDGSFAL